MTDQHAVLLLAVAGVFALTRRRRRPVRKTHVLDTFATLVDRFVTRCIVSRLPQIARKR